jgi:hypothetical protein
MSSSRVVVEAVMQTMPIMCPAAAEQVAIAHPSRAKTLVVERQQKQKSPFQPPKP